MFYFYFWVIIPEKNTHYSASSGIVENTTGFIIAHLHILKQRDIYTDYKHNETVKHINRFFNWQA